jgi:hypothetical protein
MTYSIFDNGNLVGSIDREDEAYDAFVRIAAENPPARAGLLLVAFDEEGRMVDDCVPGTRLARAS